MRVLVTGAAGFIGGQALPALRAAGHDVRGTDRRDGPGVEAVADLRERTAYAPLLDGIDAVCHLAAVVGHGVDAQDLPRYAAGNALATAELLAAMDRMAVGVLVLSSSMVVYGEGRYTCPEHGVVAPEARRPHDLDAGRFDPRCPHDDARLEPGLVAEGDRLDPRSGYAATKVAQEHLASAWSRLTGGTVAMLRYHNVYGPGMPRDTPYSGVAALFRSALEQGAPPRVFEDGAMRRDFVHVRDVARANALALTGAPRGEVRAYNVASGEPHTVGEMACALAAALDGPAPVVTGEWRRADVRHVVADPARARAELGLEPSVSFADGMRELATAELGTAPPVD